MNTLQENKDIVRRFNKEFIQDGNMDTFKELIAPGFIYQTAPPEVPKGPEGIIYYYNIMLKPAFHNLTVEIHDMVAEGDKVTTRKTFHATHDAEFLEVPATGRKVVMRIIDIVRLFEGKIIEHWNVMDWGFLMAQITAKL
jgi:predicted ester cyclase